MESDRVDQMVATLRARGVMAHRADEGVYEFGIRVVIPDGSEALWTLGGAGGLDAEVMRDNTLIGFVPHVPGSETFTDAQTVDAIATTPYSEEGLLPARRVSADADHQDHPDQCLVRPAPAPLAPRPPLRDLLHLRLHRHR